MLGCALFLAAAWFVQGAVPAVALIAVASLFASLAGACGYVVTIEKSGQFVGPVFGAMNMSGNFGAALCPIVIAFVANRGSFAEIESPDWDSVLLVFIVITLAAAVCWMLLNPNGTFFESPSKTEKTA